MTRQTTWILISGACLILGSCTSSSTDSDTTVPDPVLETTTSAVTESTTTAVVEATTSTVVQTTTTVPVEELKADAVRTVEAMIQAFNEGSIEAFDELVGRYATSDPTMDYLFGPMYHVQAKVAAGGSFELTGVCHATTVSDFGDVDVDCSGVERNHYLDAGGITIPWDMSFRVRDGKVADGSTLGSYDEDGNLLPAGEDGAAGPYGPSVTYATAVMEWFYTTYTDIADRLPIDAEALRPGLKEPTIGTEWPITAWDNGIPLKSSMPTVLEYLDEFAAQSATYPIAQP